MLYIHWIVFYPVWFDPIFEQPDPKGIIPLSGEPKSLILHYLPSISSGWLYFPRALFMLLLWSETKFYYIHFEITGDPCNLIGSHPCDLFTNHTIFCSSKVTFVLNCTIIHVLTHVISVLNRAIFALYCIISVLGTKWDVEAFLFPLFNKPATWSIKYCYWLNSAFSKWL